MNPISRHDFLLLSAGAAGWGVMSAMLAGTESTITVKENPKMKETEKENILWSRKVPVRYTADVAVLGGGIAGVTAACAAAREGASVILVERFTVTGGNATVGGVANWSGETRGQGAIFDEIIKMQEEWNSIVPYPGPYKHHGKERVFDHEILAVILQELLLRYGVKLLLHTQMVDAQVKKNRITEVMVCGPSGPEALQAKIFIDCTGEALVAHTAGFSTMKGRAEDGVTLPPSLMCFVRDTKEHPAPQLPKGWFQPVSREEDLPMTSVWPNGPGGKALKIKVIGFDNTDTEGMTGLEIRARRKMFEVLDYYQRVKKKPWLFDHCSPRIGIREGRRIVGEYVLTVDDVRQGKEFDDAIARGCYILDCMSPDIEKRVAMVSQEEAKVPPYHIPMRSLIARDSSNLLMAGRCFSADQLALSSARIMPTCAMMGQAAGILAGMSLKKKCDPKAIDGLPVRKTVEKYKAVLDLK